MWDPEIERLVTRVNTDLVEVVRPDHEALEELRWLVERHARAHRFGPGRRAAAAWDDHRDQLWHIAPRGRSTSMSSTNARRVATA